MLLQEFFQTSDKPGTIVLLEGKRKVLDQDSAKLIALGRLLCAQSSHILFRSGNASGADELFAEGVAAIDKARMEVIVPFDGHGKQRNKGYATHSLDEIVMANEPDLVYQTMENAKNKNLIQAYVSGQRENFAMKASYLIRDTAKVIGTSDGKIPPAHFAFFYDDLKNPNQGGTGHTMNICRMNNLPFVDQRVWMEWV